MKKFGIALAATLILGWSGSVWAGAIYEPEASLKDVVTPTHNWSGFYAGAHLGYGWSDKDWTLIQNAGNQPSNQIGTIITSHDADGWLGGIQLGANHQMDNIVIGGELEISWSDMDGYSTWTPQGGPNAGVFRDASTDINWMLLLSARAGLAFDKTLAYVKAGVAWADEDYTHTGGSVGTPRFLKGDDRRVGWLAGVGLEHAYDENWSVKLEYNYIDFGDERISLTDGDRTALFDVDQEMHVVKVGVNYRLVWDRPIESLK